MPDDIRTLLDREAPGACASHPGRPGHQRRKPPLEARPWPCNRTLLHREAPARYACDEFPMPDTTRHLLPGAARPAPLV